MTTYAARPPSSSPDTRLNSIMSVLRETEVAVCTALHHNEGEGVSWLCKSNPHLSEPTDFVVFFRIRVSGGEPIPQEGFIRRVVLAFDGDYLKLFWSTGTRTESDSWTWTFEPFVNGPSNPSTWLEGVATGAIHSSYVSPEEAVDLLVSMVRWYGIFLARWAENRFGGP